MNDIAVTDFRIENTILKALQENGKKKIFLHKYDY